MVPAPTEKQEVTALWLPFSSSSLIDFPQRAIFPTRSWGCKLLLNFSLTPHNPASTSFTGVGKASTYLVLSPP